MGSSTKQNKHEDRAHALLSPSDAKRWMNCPGALVLGADIPEPPTSEFALEGTLAHEWAERILRLYQYEGQATAWRALAGCADEEMRHHVGEYVKWIGDLYERFNAHTKKKHGEVAELTLEERVKLTDRIWGTKDIGMSCSKELIVADLKYGRGVDVDPKNNPQLIIYGLATAETHDLDQLERMILYINQPRTAGASDPVILNRKDIAHWKTVILAAEKRALKVIKEKDLSPKNFKVGDWCRFCKVQPVCSYFKSEAKREVIDLIPADFPEIVPMPKKKDPKALAKIERQKAAQIKTLTIEQRVEILKRKALIEDFLKAVEASLFARLEAGLKVPGYKLIETKGKRGWRKDKSVEHIGSILKKLGVLKPFRVEKSLITLGEAMRAVPESKRAQLDKLVKASEGRKGIAPESDHREEVVGDDLDEL